MKTRREHKPIGGMGAVLLAGTAQADKWSDHVSAYQKHG